MTEFWSQSKFAENRSDLFWRSSRDKTTKPEFLLPERNANDKRVFAYLSARGIDAEIINACMRMGLVYVYESKRYHNAVFVGQKDDEGRDRHASLRGTFANAVRPYKGDAAGSDKSYAISTLPELW